MIELGSAEEQEMVARCLLLVIASFLSASVGTPQDLFKVPGIPILLSRFRLGFRVQGSGFDVFLALN